MKYKYSIDYSPGTNLYKPYLQSLLLCYRTILRTSSLFWKISNASSSMSDRVGHVDFSKVDCYTSWLATKSLGNSYSLSFSPKIGK